MQLIENFQTEYKISSSWKMRCFGLPCQIFFADEYDGDIYSSHGCCGGTVHIKVLSKNISNF